MADLWETFKDWATSGTAEAEALDLRSAMKALRVIGRRAPKRTGEKLVEKSYSFEKMLEQKYPKTIFGPVKEIGEREFQDQASFYLKDYPGTIKGQGILSLNTKTIGEISSDDILNNLMHEATHGGQFYPHKFIGTKRIPEEIQKLLDFEYSTSENLYKEVAEKVKKTYHTVEPFERHADKIAEDVIMQQYPGLSMFTKQSQGATGEKFLPQFYQELQREILTMPKRAGAYGGEFTERIKDLGIEPMSLQEWEQLFKEIK